MAQIGKILLVKQSKIFHKEKRQNEKIQKKFLWFKKNRIRFEMLWLKYYGLRNSIYLAKRYSTNKFVNLLILKLCLELCKDILLYDDRKLLRLRFAINSCLDGIRGVFENDKSKKILEVL